jgi:hypothetical protein
MDHVSESRERDELALWQLPMQALRLAADIGNLIVGACDDRDRLLELPVVMLELHH